jgi:tetratricopeptide (TPR) repeat protein
VLSVSARKFRRGSAGLGCKGSVEYTSLTIYGRCDPKKLRDVLFKYEEVMSKIFFQTAEKPPKKRPFYYMDLSVEHPYLMKVKLGKKNKRKYYRIKTEIAKCFERGYYSIGKIKGQIGTLDALIKKCPDYSALYYLKGMVQLRLGDAGNAIEALEKAAKKNPDFYEAKIGVAKAYMRAGLELKNALKYVDEVIKKYRPDSFEAYTARGKLRFMLANPGEGLKDLDFALALYKYGSKAYKEGCNFMEAFNFRKQIKLYQDAPRILAIQTRTKYHKICTDITKERAERFRKNLEAALKYFCDSFDFEKIPAKKPRVMIFNNRDSFFSYGRLRYGGLGGNVLGLYSHEFNELLFFDSINEEETLGVMYHESFHQFAHKFLRVNLPYWANEGLAEYFGSVKIKDGKITKKSTIQTGRLMGIKSVVRVGRYVSFEKIMNYTPAEFYGPYIGLHYAQAWAMVHFIMEYENGKYKKTFMEYIKMFQDPKQKIRDAYKKTFGKLDIKKMEKEWCEFVKKLK